MNFAGYHTLTINGETLTGLEIIQYCKNSGSENIRQIGQFMSEWLSDKPSMEVQTSGSTGTPKILSVEKNQMLQSAAMTAQYFDFKTGQTAVLCLPMHYIAGKMMVVRALFSGLNLYCIEPGRSPVDLLPDDQLVHFLPLIPMQLQGVSDTKSVQKILLGGAPVSSQLEETCQLLKADIYHGYGMTETLSHVAIRRLNGPHRTEVYEALPGVSFDIDDQNRLMIDVPFLARPVQTNDVVELIDEQQFIWRGRADLVVNSGGIKLFPEEIENKIFAQIRRRFFVAGVPDERFGEKLALFIEGPELPGMEFRALSIALSELLDKYERPREIFFIKQFQTTTSGKIRRRETVNMYLHR